MANYKRKKPRRQVKCTLCTPNRVGNSKQARPIGDKRQLQERKDGRED